MKIDTRKLFLERANARLTTKELAQKANIGTKTYSKIENGHVQPKATTIGKIARALNVPVKELFNE